MAVIQGGGVGYDAGASVRASFDQLRQGITTGVNTELKLREQAAQNFTLAGQQLMFAQQASGLPMQMFLAQYGAPYLDTMNLALSKATGRQLTGDEARLQTNQLVEFLQKPENMTKETLTRFALTRGAVPPAQPAEPTAPSTPAPTMPAAGREVIGAGPERGGFPAGFTGIPRQLNPPSPKIDYKPMADAIRRVFNSSGSEGIIPEDITDEQVFQEYGRWIVNEGAVEGSGVPKDWAGRSVREVASALLSGVPASGPKRDTMGSVAVRPGETAEFSVGATAPTTDTSRVRALLTAVGAGQAAQLDDERVRAYAERIVVPEDPKWPATWWGKSLYEVSQMGPVQAPPLEGDTGTAIPGVGGREPNAAGEFGGQLWHPPLSRDGQAMAPSSGMSPELAALADLGTEQFAAALRAKARPATAQGAGAGRPDVRPDYSLEWGPTSVGGAGYSTPKEPPKKEPWKPTPPADDAAWLNQVNFGDQKQAAWLKINAPEVYEAYKKGGASMAVPLYRKFLASRGLTSIKIPPAILATGQQPTAEKTPESTEEKKPAATVQTGAAAQVAKATEAKVATAKSISDAWVPGAAKTAYTGPTLEQLEKDPTGLARTIETVQRYLGEPTDSFKAKSEAHRAAGEAGTWLNAVWNKMDTATRKQFIADIRANVENMSPEESFFTFGSDFADMRSKSMEAKARIAEASAQVAAAEIAAGASVYSKAAEAALQQGAVLGGHIVSFLKDATAVAKDKGTTLTELFSKDGAKADPWYRDQYLKLTGMVDQYIQKGGLGPLVETVTYGWQKTGFLGLSGSFKPVRATSGEGGSGDRYSQETLTYLKNRGIDTSKLGK